jgi:2-desacetyl-2-hydroxyethyl bacteriochlorophyllide A dehydrogenase
MIGRALYFTAPGSVELRAEDIPEPGPGEVLAETVLSAISAGSEILIYRGEGPERLSADSTIKALAGQIAFPMRYGYSTVGKVISMGSGIDPSWIGRQVFSFQPHGTHFIADAAQTHPLPEGITPEDSVFLPNMETAVNLAMDGRPMIGETVLVIGQGIVGILTTALLSRFPLGRLLTMDHHPDRRRMSLDFGADESLDPASADIAARIDSLGNTSGGVDLVYELSGNPAALESAITACGFAGRIVVGSWYGRRTAPIDFGGRFHRNRLSIISSQVSTIAPELTGRWSKQRRVEATWRLLKAVRPSRLITTRFHIERASEAYRMLDEDPSSLLQVVLTY